MLPNRAMHHIFKKYLKGGRPNTVYENLQTITWYLTEAISSSRSVYYECFANKLSDPNNSLKAYWSTIKTLASGKRCQLYPQY